MSCLHGKNTDQQVGILQLLDTDESSVGAHNQTQGPSDEKRACVMDSSNCSSVLTAHAGDRGVNLTPPARVNKCYSACQCDEVIKPRNHHQTTARCTSCAEQYDSVRHLLLYPCRQGIRSQLSPIIEQDECYDSTAIASLKVSQHRSMSVPSLSSFGISSQSYYDPDLLDNNFDCSAFRCIFTAGPKAEQRRIVPDVRTMAGEQPGDVIAISGQDEPDEHFSCDNNAWQMTVCDQQVMQNFEDTAFPETSRKTEVKTKEGGD